MLSYVIRGALLPVARSYWVEDPAGARLFRIAGKLWFPRAFSVKDPSGQLLYSVREKMLTLDYRFVISRAGAEAATVRKTSLSGSGDDKFEIVLATGDTLTASGKLWTEVGMRIRRNNNMVATIRREQGVHLREEFKASAVTTMDQPLFLAIAMSIVEIDPSRGNGSV